MLMTMRVEMAPGGDLGFLLEKHPDRLQSRDTTFGCAYVFYPQVEPTFAQVALLLDVDPVKLVRGTPTSVSGGLLEDYVNDRPYSAASFMAVALKAVFASAMKGESRARPELAPQAFPLEIHFPSLSVRGRVGVIHDWFEPLGYYGPEYALPGNIERIRPRKVGHKRSGGSWPTTLSTVFTSASLACWRWRRNLWTPVSNPPCTTKNFPAPASG